MKKMIFALMLLLCATSLTWAQQSDADYRKVIYGRADKIVQTLAIQDTAQYRMVLDVIADQYIELGKINDAYDANVKAIKESTASKEEKDRLNEREYLSQQSQLYARHNYFIAQLNARLTPEQIEKVKDGMTMGVYAWTLNGFFDMIPSLTEEERTHIRALLMEAREYAMDCSSSKTKHAWFGKYKGRLNNYLSARGYDLQKERDAWNERNKQKSAQ